MKLQYFSIFFLLSCLLLALPSTRSFEIILSIESLGSAKKDESNTEKSVSTNTVVENGPDPSCKQPIEKGPCYAAFPRFAYDPLKGGCFAFLYGGCGGNENNFRTHDECLKNCNVAQFKNSNFDDVPTNDKTVVEAN
ncbi:tissue factor pathway inhibitor-like [Cloeon dipterum]|uniref:tissue factor pathway inhibitor-like n=1 Tax=Cloeon dipterum TaxID=197152 RepID=UPI0032208CFD